MIHPFQMFTLRVALFIFVFPLSVFGQAIGGIGASINSIAESLADSFKMWLIGPEMFGPPPQLPPEPPIDNQNGPTPV